MKRILGLDLGTTSIGWAVVDLATKPEEQSSIIKLGVRVNPLTVDEKGAFEKGKAIETTAKRTQMRGMRRNLKRYQQRRSFLLSVLRQYGIINQSQTFSEDGPSSTFATYRLRAKAASEEISLEQFARVLLMINKKRGYKSNRKTKADPSEDGQIVDSMDIARKLYDDDITPGQYLNQTYSASHRYVPSFYRSDLKDEFERVWAFQSQFHSDILTAELHDQLQGRGSRDTSKMFVAKFGVYAADNKGKAIEKNMREFRWRAEALESKQDIRIVAYVLASLNGQIAASSGYLGAISDHSKELIFRNQTVGQYLMECIDADPHYRIKGKVFYRADYMREFDVIWEAQARFHRELTSELKKLIRDVVIFHQRPLKSKKFLISHCELESKEVTTPDGKTVISGPRVSPKSSPLFQDFKIWQQLNDVVVTNRSVSRSRVRKKSSNVASFDFGPDYEDEPRESRLTVEQMETLHRELSVCGEMKADAALKLLGLDNKQYSLNFTKLHGNNTVAALFAALKKVIEWSGHDVEKFDSMDAAGKVDMTRKVLEAIGGKSDYLSLDNSNLDGDSLMRQPLYKLWHLLYSYEGDNSDSGNAKLVEHVSRLTGLNKDYAAAIAAITFDDDYGSLSTKAMARILPHLMQGLQYSDACEAAGYRHSKRSLTAEENESRQLLASLDVLPKNSLRNPVVEKIINQMIHVVNAAMREYGVDDESGVRRFDEIHVEIGRELRQTQEQRERATKALADRTRETEAIMDVLVKEFHIAHPSRGDVLRYRLYEQLSPIGYHTLYSNRYIPREKLFSPEIDIEHIIPQALYYDDSEANKTLEYRSVNQAKGRLTAYDYVASLGEETLREYEERIKFLDTRGTQRKFKNLMMTERKVALTFSNRDLTTTQYISRKAMEILGQVTREVLAVTGSITAVLREDWQLVDVMKELNLPKYQRLGMVEEFANSSGHRVRRIKNWTKRNDHRHHAMDALTVAFTTRSHVQYINTVHSHESDEYEQAIVRALRKKLISQGENPRYIAPMPVDELRAEALRHLSQVIVSVKAKNKVATRALNKPRGSAVVQHTLTPRTQLHNETIYGRRQRYSSREVKVDKTFDASRIATVARRDYREALMRRLSEFGGDPSKAFTGKNALDKKPLFVDAEHRHAVPPRVKVVVLETYYTIRKPLGPDFADAKKIAKVVDARVRRLLLERYEARGKDAFSNLEEDPIYLNREAGIVIKRVTIEDNAEVEDLRVKRDKEGRIMVDEKGNPLRNDYVRTNNNHHIAIFEDEDGRLHEHVVSYYKAMVRLRLGLPVIDKDYNAAIGWKFLFTMKINEYFVLPDSLLSDSVRRNSQGGFEPEYVDLLNPVNQRIVNDHLFRVQKLSKSNYMFRHQYETNVDEVKELKGITYVNVCSANNLRGIVKVRVDHLGRIVHVGEY